MVVLYYLKEAIYVKNKGEIEMNTDFLDIVTNREKIQKELIFYSLFLMVFENFVHHWKETIRSFFSNGFAKDEQTGVL